MVDDDRRCGSSSQPQDSSDGGTSPSGGDGGPDPSGGREDTPPAACAALCGPRVCNTLPPTLSPSHATGNIKNKFLLHDILGISFPFY